MESNDPGDDEHLLITKPPCCRVYQAQLEGFDLLTLDMGMKYAWQRCSFLLSFFCG